MKHLSTYLTGLAVVSFAAVVQVSCVYDYSLCEQVSRVSLRLVVDWDKAPDASPAGVAACFFPVGDGEIWRFDIPSKYGGDISLPPGKYHLLLFNNDTSDVLFSNVDSYDSYDASTPQAAVPYMGSAHDGTIYTGEPLHDCPDMLWSAAITSVTVTGDTASDDGVELSQDIVCHPDELCARYHVTIDDVCNLGGVSHMYVLLSGMSGSVEMAMRDLSDTPVALPVDVSRKSGTSVAGDFLTFGRCDDLSVENILYFVVWLADGSCHSYDFNVTRQILDAPDPRDVHIRVTGVDLPVSEPSHGEESTLDVEVVDWSTTYIELETRE